MERVKHTPGEWTIQKFRMKAGYFIRISPSAPDIAIVKENGEEGEANARLIASAPELLEMCKEFVFLEKTNMTKKQTQLRIDMAKSVIAKAEGRKED